MLCRVGCRNKVDGDSIKIKKSKLSSAADLSYRFVKISEVNILKAVENFVTHLSLIYATGNATEHSYRSAPSGSRRYCQWRSCRAPWLPTSLAVEATRDFSFRTSAALPARSMTPDN